MQYDNNKLLQFNGELCSFMIMNIPLISLITLFYISLAEGITLQSVFDSSGPGNGYDKYVVLEQNMIYSGGIGIYEGNVLIEGNGAVVDLEGGTGIWVYGY